MIKLWIKKISDRNVKFLTMKLLHQKQSPGRVLQKKFFRKFRKSDSRKPVSDSDTGPFLSILQNFQEHIFYWTPPVVAFSNFKAPKFTEAVMQMNFWIHHDLAHLNTLSYSRHFCVYFRLAQAFRCIPTASLTLDILYFLDKERKK